MFLKADKCFKLLTAMLIKNTVQCIWKYKKKIIKISYLWSYAFKRDKLIYEIQKVH